jgi:hypothetical protein
MEISGRRSVVPGSAYRNANARVVVDREKVQASWLGLHALSPRERRFADRQLFKIARVHQRSDPKEDEQQSYT